MGERKYVISIKLSMKGTHLNAYGDITHVKRANGILYIII